jgi:O-antigen ligase
MARVGGSWGSRVGRTAEVLGAVGLATFAFSCLLSTSGASIGLALLVGAMMLRPSLLRGLRRDPLILLAAASTIYLVFRTVWALWEMPEIRRLHISQAWAWLRLWFVLVVAWWLQGDSRRSARLLLLALLGLLLGTVGHLLVHPDILSSGIRTGFHLKIIAFGLYSSTAILGLLVFAPRLLGRKELRPSFVLRVGLWFITLAVLVQGLIMTQSRGAWLTAAIGIPAVTMVRYWKADSRQGRSRRLRVAFVGVALFACATLVGVNLRTVTARLSGEREMFAAAWRGDFKAVPTAGFGVRVHTFRFGVTKWLERPLFGWGPGCTEYLISHSGLPQLRHSEMVDGEWQEGPDWLDHLHNTYLEILVRFGLVGAFFMFCSLGLLVRGLWLAHREGRIPLDYAWFLTGALGLMAIWSLSDFRLLHPDWRSYWILIGGITATFHLWKRVPACPDAEAPFHHQTKAEHYRGRHE